MKSVNINNTNKSSPTQVQSSIFVVNLRQEMDKMATNCRKNEMIKAAHEYIHTGMSKKETEELLQLDGFDPIMVRAFIENGNFSEEFENDMSPRWGFDIEDARGRIYSSNEDFGIVITAKSEQEARTKAEEEIEKFSTLELDTVTNLYRL
jgi:hypothetical protein